MTEDKDIPSFCYRYRWVSVFIQRHTSVLNLTTIKSTSSPRRCYNFLIVLYVCFFVLPPQFSACKHFVQRQTFYEQILRALKINNNKTGKGRLCGYMFFFLSEFKYKTFSTLSFEVPTKMLHPNSPFFPLKCSFSPKSH